MNATLQRCDLSPAQCWVCLDTNHTLLPLLTEIEVCGSKIRSIEMYTAITGIRLNQSDDQRQRTPKICISCFKDLNSAYQFRQRAIDAHQQLTVTVATFERQSTSSFEMQGEMDEWETSEVPTDGDDDSDGALKIEYIEVEEEMVEAEVVEEEDEIEEEHTIAGSTIDELEMSKKAEATVSVKTTQIEAITMVDNVDQSEKCFACEQVFRNDRDLTAHFTEEHSRQNKMGGYICLICNSEFSNVKTFRQHCQVHKNKKRYCCLYCGKAFHYSHHLKVHELYHTQERRFQCPKCEKRFATKDRLQNHMQIHLLEQNFQCDQCCSAFKSKKYLHVHKSVKHDAVVDGFVPISCEVCHKILFSKTAASNHMRKCTARAKKLCKLSCSLCHQPLEGREQLKHHLMGHDEVNALYECESCESIFTMPAQLEEHRDQQHRRNRSAKVAENRVYVCKICSKQFSQQVILRRHQMTHTGQKPYECNFCQRRFVQQSTLQNHLRTHTNEMPYKCHYCLRPFRSIASLQSHQKRIHDGETKAE